MPKRIIINIYEAIYNSLVRVIGRGKISQFLEDLIRPCVVYDLHSVYQAMAADVEREREALEWSNALIGDVVDAMQ